MRIHPPDPGVDQPPFDQLRSQIARRAASGDLAPGAKLPTVRGLATELGLAANTVARAYRELEADGVVVTEGRRGTFVAATAAASSADARRAIWERSWSNGGWSTPGSGGWIRMSRTLLSPAGPAMR